MRILGIYIQHDACAAIFDDYRLIAAVAQERPTRRKGDGGRFPTEAARECLEQAGLSFSDVDVVCLPRTRYPKEYFTLRAHLPFPQQAKDDSLELIRVMVRNFIKDPLKAFDARAYLAQYELAPKEIYFYNHHLSHALGVLFHTRWDDAVAVGAQRTHAARAGSRASAAVGWPYVFPRPTSITASRGAAPQEPREPVVGAPVVADLEDVDRPGASGARTRTRRRRSAAGGCRRRCAARRRYRVRSRTVAVAPRRRQHLRRRRADPDDLPVCAG